MTRTLILVFVCVFLFGCSSKNAVVVEQAPILKPTVESTPVRIEVAQAPKLPEIQEAIKRVFKDAAVLDPNQNPNFLAGDFNGDHSQDLAVILKPVAGKLTELNEEYPRWLLRDPRAKQTDRKQPLQIEKDETLLAVIHGYGINDWRDPEATQTFVLKNVVGQDLRVHSEKEFVAANTGRKLPRPQGDLIGETLQGTPGYLYYAVSTYSWYDPKTFDDKPQTPGVFHKSRTMRAHAQKAPAVGAISAEELKGKLDNNDPVAIIDVRGSEGYAASQTTIKGAWHFKLRRLKSRFKFAPLKDLPKDREIVTYCACPKDESSYSAAQIFQNAGFKRVRVLQGGWNEWLKNKGQVQTK